MLIGKKLSTYPDENGKYGEFGGRYAPESLRPALIELEEAFMSRTPEFLQELTRLNQDYGGRPTPLYHAKRLSDHVGGAQIYLKREDLLHGGAHKINNVLGQALLAKELGKKRIIAETGAGQHGVATAMVGALFGFETEIYMGAKDIERQKPNVDRMELLGAEVIPVDKGSSSLKDAVNEALRDWVGSVETTHYMIGSVVGPHPFPLIVREFQSVIGQEIKEQSHQEFGKLPDLVVACVGGGSNAAGTFYPLIDNSVDLIGVEAGGNSQGHGATISKGSPGIFHGAYSYVLQDNDGQIQEAHSISAGLDYPGVGPEHSFWRSVDRVRYEAVTDDEAVRAFYTLSRMEGIIPAIESSHAISKAVEIAAVMHPEQNIVVTLSGRGDKDLLRKLEDNS